MNPYNYNQYQQNQLNSYNKCIASVGSRAQNTFE